MLPMKRNMDLIRDILLDIESKPAGEMIQTIGYDSEKYTGEEMRGHLRLIDQAGLVDGKFRFLGESTLIAIHGLSNEGHDLLDAIRGDTVWARTKERVEEVGGSVTLDTLKAIATAVAAKLLGL
jgi:hypothetical protein